MANTDFLGIDRNSSFAEGKVGTADWVLNLKHEGGAYHPVNEYDELFRIKGNITPLYIHGGTDYENMIGIRKDGSLTYIYFIAQKDIKGVWRDPRKKDVELGGEVESFPVLITKDGIEGYKTIAHVGNTLIVYDKDGANYFLWRDNDYAYDFLGDKIPKVKIEFDVEDVDNEDYQNKFIEGNIKFSYNKDEYNDGAIFAYTNGTFKKGFGENVKEENVENSFKNEGYVPINVVGADEDITNAMLGVYNGAISFVYENGNVCQPMLLCVGIRLYDGSYVNVTPFVYLFNGIINGERILDDTTKPWSFRLDYNEQNTVVKNDMMWCAVSPLAIDDSAKNTHHPTVRFKARSLYYHILNRQGEFDRWKDIISSIDLFMSKPVNVVDTNKKIEGAITLYPVWGDKIGSPNVYVRSKFTIPESVEPNKFNTKYFPIDPSIVGEGWATEKRESVCEWKIPYRPAGEIMDDLKKVNTFFRLKKIDIKDIKQGALISLKDDIKKIYPVLEQMPQLKDIVTSGTMTSDKVYLYNNRLHLIGVTENPTPVLDVASQGYNISNADLETIYPNISGINPDQFNTVALAIKATDKKGNVFVSSCHYDLVRRKNLSALQMVMKSNIKKIEYYSLLLYFPTTSLPQLVSQHISFDAEEHNYYDASQHISSYMKPIRLTPVALDKKNGWELTAQQIPYQDQELWFGTYRRWLDALKDELKENIKNNEYQNEIAVSEPDNPFAFMPENIIQVGNGKIIDVATITSPISEGQYGYYLLYVFTDGGIYSLQPGMKVAYESIKPPLNRDVAIGDVTPIDGAIVFPTNKGLMMITGRNVSLLSEIVHGKPQNLPMPFNDDEFTFMRCLVSDFLDDIVGSDIFYDYKNNELIINPDDSKNDNLWVYDINNKIWGQRFYYEVENFMSNYPDLYAYGSSLVENGRVLYDCSKKKKNTRDFTFVSRTYAFDNEMEKKLTSFIIRCRLKGEMNDTFRLTILSGNNPDNLINVGTIRLTGKAGGFNKKDLHFNRIMKSFKYIKFMICGHLSDKTEINSFLLSTDNSLDTKLR